MLTKMEDADMRETITEGLEVIYDGDRNFVIFDAERKAYAPGALICEYARFAPNSLKEIIVKAPHFNEVKNDSNLTKAIFWLYEEVHEKYPLVIAEMINAEFMEEAIKFANFSDEELKEHLSNEELYKKDDKIIAFILEGTGFDDFNGRTVGQILLFSYYSFAMSYVTFRHLFDSFIAAATDGGATEFPWELFGELAMFQHIDYKIVFFEGKFHSLYTFKSSVSLLVFEIAHAMDHETQIVKCQNCGHYFVPDTRVDAVYCNYESPQKPGKTCRNVGAQIARADKEKNDAVTKSYRKVYMRYVMHMNRHPEDEDKQKMFDKLTEEVKNKRKSLEEGTITEEDFFDWLDQF